MRKGYLWLTLVSLHFALKLRVIKAAADEREHVHIKVHMPEVIRKHTHYQKVQKHHHHHRHHPHSHRHHVKKLVPMHNLLELDNYEDDHIAPYFATNIPMLPEPDLTPNYGPALFDNDITPTQSHKQNMRMPQQTPQPPPPATSSTMSATPQMPMSQQLMQHILSPDIMSALAGGDTNTLMADDFLAELQREYSNKYAPQRIRQERLTQAKVHKRKKYGSAASMVEGGGYTTVGQQQQYYANQAYRNNNNHNYYQQHGHYNDNNNNNNYFDNSAEDDDNEDSVADDDDLDEIAGDTSAYADTDFDDKYAHRRDVNGFVNPFSYQDSYTAHTPAASSSRPTIPTPMNWRQYQQKQQQQLHQHQHEQEPLVLPINGIAAATFTNDYQQRHQHQNRYKKRKNRIKRKRIVVQ